MAAPVGSLTGSRDSARDRRTPARDLAVAAMAVGRAVVVVSPAVLVRKRPQDAGAGARSGTGRQHGRARADDGRGNGEGRGHGLPVQHATHLEKGDRERAERDQPAPSRICERISARSSSACFPSALRLLVGEVATSLPPRHLGRCLVAHPAKHAAPRRRRAVPAVTNPKCCPTPAPTRATRRALAQSLWRLSERAAGRPWR